jgi:hypothetical protein
MARQKKRKKRSPNRSPKYEGTLAEPIYEPALVLGLLGDRRLAKAQAQKRARLRIISKFPELFRCYRVNPYSSQRWLQLAFRLAVAHVPGMQIRDKPKASTGPKPKWSTLGPALIQDVNATRTKSELQGKKITLKRAIAQLQADPEKREWHERTVESLETRYREALAKQKEEDRWVLEKMKDQKSLVSEMLRLQAAAQETDVI